MAAVVVESLIMRIVHLEIVGNDLRNFERRKRRSYAGIVKNVQRGEAGRHKRNDRQTNLQHPHAFGMAMCRQPALCPIASYDDAVA